MIVFSDTASWRIPLCFAAILACGILRAQPPVQGWTNAWPSDSAGVVLVNDSVDLTWAPVSGAHSSYGLLDRIALRYDPRRRMHTTAMDVHVNVAVRATKNPDHGNFNSGANHDSLFVLGFHVGVRGDSLYPQGLDSALARITNDTKHFTNAHRYWLKITSVTADFGNGDSTLTGLPKGLYFDLNIDWLATAQLDLNNGPSGAAVAEVICGPTSNAPPSELVLSWNTVSGAIGYDVEWTWVDNYEAVQGGTYSDRDPDLIAYDMRRDATRAATPNTSYRIPLLYDRGYLVWRVRAIGAAPGYPELVVHTAWSGADPSGNIDDVASPFVQEIVAHEGRKNWQVTTSFAEEGKRKEVMTYADGTSRARQVQTRSNSLNVPIIGETIYDATGRPVVEVMPVPKVNDGCPTDNNAWAPIDYVPGFNVEDSLGATRTYDRWDLAAQGECGQTAEPMHPDNGAERYYSNDFANSTGSLIEPPQFLPRAEGYPLAHTEYTRDNTGRVRSKGGVGVAFQMDGHPTTTLYGNAMQIQLDRLFGSEAGYAQHFQRNVTIDPNGQASVAYIDMFGRTVATALECLGPEDLEPVGAPGGTLTTDLFNGLPSTSPALAQQVGNEMRFNTQFAVACNATYTFDYGVEMLYLRDSCWVHEDELLCAHCVYELEMRLTDACGEVEWEYPPANAPALLGTVQFTDPAVMFACEPDGNWTAPSADMTEYLEPGEYTLTKILRLHQPAIDRYVELLLDPELVRDTCMLTYDDFLADALDAVDTTDCHVDCNECYTALGSLDDYLASGQGTEAGYHAMRTQCDELCRVDSWCDVLYETMLADLSKQGQYGTYIWDGLAGNDASIPDRTSVFFKPDCNNGIAGVLGRKFIGGTEPWQQVNNCIPLWRQPWLETDGQTFQEYHDEVTGLRTKVYLVENGNNYIPQVVNATIVEEEDGFPFTYPENLVRTEDFLAAFQPGWERSLLRFHPEYCYYRSCREYGQPFVYESNQALPVNTSDAYDGKILLADMYDQAVAAGLIAIGGGAPQLLNDDPFITSGSYGGYAAALSAKYTVHTTLLGEPYSMPQVATVMATLGGAFPPSAGSIPPFGTTTGSKDAEWAALRGLYRSAKYGEQKRRGDDLAKTCACAGLNYCIGQQSTGTWWHRMQTTAPSYPYWWQNWSAQPRNQPCQPCNYYTYWNYTNKVPRVSEPSQTPGMQSTALEQSYSLFQITGQCPMGTAWLAFLGQLAADDLLGTNGTHDISNSAGWLGINVAQNDMQLDTDAPPETLTVTVNSGVGITLQLNNHVCPLTLDEPGLPDHPDFAWDRVTQFTTLVAQPFSTTFTVVIHYTESNGTPRMAEVEGTLCALYQLAPCNFPRVCEPNQLARDVQDLWNMVHSGPGTTTSNLQLNSYYPPASSETCHNLLGNSIKGPFAQTGLVLQWSYAMPGPKIHVQNIGQSGTVRYRFDIIEAEPSTFGFTAGEWAGIAYFNGINADNENFFVITGYDASDMPVVRLRCQAWFESGGETHPVSMGECELPGDPACDEPQYTMGSQLAQVIEDLVYNNPLPPAAGSSAFASPSMTEALAQHMCGAPDLLIQNVFHSTSVVQFDLACQAQTGFCAQVTVPLNAGEPIGNGFNASAISYHTPNSDTSAYQGMTMPLAPNGMQAANVLMHCTLFQPCDNCPPDPISAQELTGYTEEELIEQKRLLVDSIWLSYGAYKAAVDSFNTQWDLPPTDTAFVAAQEYGAFRSKGFWQSKEAYADYLRRYKPGIDEQARAQDLGTFVIEQSNARNAKEEYARYLSSVDHYNTRALAISRPAITAEGDSLFRALLLADQLAGYVDMLFAMTPGNNPPASLAGWAEFDPNDACVQLYRNAYLPVYAALEASTTDSTGRCPGFQKYAPLVSFKEFDAARICCSDSGLMAFENYLLLFTDDSAACPGEIPRLIDCAAADTMALMTVLDPERECQRLYVMWLDAVKKYMGPPPSPHQAATGTILEISYTTYDEFLKAGMCECVKDYLEYLGSYLYWQSAPPELPPLLSLTEFCSGTVKPCKELYDDYKQTLHDYNGSAFADSTDFHLTFDFNSFEEFEREGYCRCVQAYLDYLAGYIVWTASAGDWPRPMTLKEFCRLLGDPDCRAVYQMYIAELISWQPALLDIYQEYHIAFHFHIPTYEEYDRMGLCYCVPGYLARLEVLLGMDAAAVDLELLQTDGMVWSLMRYCQIPRPCPPQEPIPPTPDLPYTADDDCVKDLLQIAAMNAQQAFDAYMDERENDLIERYRSLCLSARETLLLTFPNNEYHHTLYYYDQAGSLIRTVPPQGVLITEITHPGDSIAARISADRANGTHTYFTGHNLVSDHVYNSLGQPIRSGMPDQDPRAKWSIGQPLGLPVEFVPTGVSFAGAEGLVTGIRQGTTRGLAYATSDGGRTWQRSLGLLAADLHGGHFLSTTIGYAVGDHGTLIKTVDAGASWDLVPSTTLLDLRPKLHDTYFSASNTGIAVGLYNSAGYAAHTTNGGTSFTNLTLPGTAPVILTGIGRHTSNAYAIGGVAWDDKNGILYTATTEAGPWTAVPHARTAAHLTCGQYVDATHSYVGGELGVLLHSGDNGATWATRATGTTWDYIDIAWRDEQNGVAILDSLGLRGVLRHTNDGGHSWMPIADMPIVDMKDLYLYESDSTTKVLAVGASGRVLRLFIGDGTIGFAEMQAITGYSITKCWAGYNGTELIAVLSNGTTSLRWAKNIAIEPVAWQTITAPAAVHEVVARPATAELRLLFRTGTQYRHATITLPGGVFAASAALGTNVTGIALRPNGKGVVLQSGAPAVRVNLDVVTLPITTNAITNGVGAPAQTNAVLPLDVAAAVCVSNDGGLRTGNCTTDTWSWTDVSDKIAPLPVRAVHKDGSLAACDQGTLLVGSGTSWTAHPTPTVHDLSGVERLGGNSVAAVGGSSSALRYNTATRVHETLTLPASGNLHGAALASGALYVAADAGRVLRSVNPTAATPTWQALDHNSLAVQALLPVGNGNVYAVGGNALVHAFAGTTRMPVDELYLPQLNAVWMRDALTAYVVGDANTARYTNNGGQTWQVVPVNGTLNPLLTVSGNPETAYTGGAAKRLLQLDGADFDPVPLSGSGSTELRSLSVAAGGGLLVAGERSGNGIWYALTPGGTETTGTLTGHPLNATWAFPRFILDVYGDPYEHSHVDMLYGGDDGYVGIKRYVPATGSFHLLDPFPNTTPQIPGVDIKAFWFHDQVAGYALVDGGSGSRLHKGSGPADHGGAFTWGNTGLYIMHESGTQEANAKPACIGFPDRGTGFVGGLNTTANNGFARLITDEGGLYSQRFWYDALGRLVLSQNSKQIAMTTPRYSYSLYDDLGRVYEAGELVDATTAPNRFRDLPATDVHGAMLPQVIDPDVLKAWVQTRPRHEVTRTLYDEPLTGLSIPGFTQQHLRLRVASTFFFDEWDDVHGPDDPEGYAHATHYSYDIHGNVRTLIQDHPQLGLDGGAIQGGCTGCVEHRYKRMDYTYDLISGNVKQVDYQKDQPDRFHHRYIYDADNRIIEVESSADGANWHRDARYFYYPHGPLQRVELGEHLVQGMDYAYTLQGWLKGINGDRLNPLNDMGRDGDPSVMGNPNLLAGRDAYALSLGYYGDADYKAIGDVWNTVTERPFAPIGTSGTLHAEHRALYNGNIAHTVNTLQPFGLWNSGNGSQGQVLAQVYRYDQLNRLKKARGIEGMGSGNTWDGVTDGTADRYRSEYEYDANGNILTANRYDNDGNHYDAFSYKYEKRGGRVVRNRLYQLNDLADEDNDWVNESGGAQDIGYTGDVAFDEEDPDINDDYNYGYDALGNLVRDTREGITNIEWTVAGKVRSVTKATGPSLSFSYGASGQRTIKQVSDPDLEATGYREHYIRDAQGNIMATYRYTNDVAASLKLNERPVYGSSRLGSLRKEEELYALPSFSPATANPVQQADLNYELTDHLGNVCAVVTGRLLDGNGGGTPKQAELISATGFESFGSLLPGRNYSSGSYRFGLNGQEKDDEVYGSTGTSYTAEFWQYDPRTARRWNLDPKYNPSISRYATFALNPIGFSDPRGDTVQVSFRAGGFLGLKKHTLNYQDGKLFNRGDGSEYQGKVSKFGQQVASDLNTLSKGSEGGQALGELIASSNVFNIVQGRENKFEPTSRSRAGLGRVSGLPEGYELTGSGGTVYFNPNSGLGPMDTRGLFTPRSFVTLGHELLGHGRNANRGMTDYRPIPGHESLTMDEYSASDMENRIRAEHFLPLRAYYGVSLGPDGSPSGGYIPLLSDGKRGIMSGHDYYGVMRMVPRPILLNR